MSRLLRGVNHEGILVLNKEFQSALTETKFPRRHFMVWMRDEARLENDTKICKKIKIVAGIR